MEYMEITGVHSWEEVQFDELQKKSKKNIISN